MLATAVPSMNPRMVSANRTPAAGIGANVTQKKYTMVQKDQKAAK